VISADPTCATYSSLEETGTTACSEVDWISGATTTFASAAASGPAARDLAGLAWHCYYGAPSVMSAKAPKPCIVTNNRNNLPLQTSVYDFGRAMPRNTSSCAPVNILAKSRCTRSNLNANEPRSKAFLREPEFGVRGHDLHLALISRPPTVGRTCGSALILSLFSSPDSHLANRKVL